MLQRESQTEKVCDVCNGSRFIGVTPVIDGFDFIECEKCHGTGHVSVVEFRLASEEDED